MRRKLFVVSGQVQGVGFRPFVFKLAARLKLSGNVRNAPQGVLIEVQGMPEALEAFHSALFAQLPPLARISHCVEHELELMPLESGFSILPTIPGSAHEVLISPDVASCPDCLIDVHDPAGRRVHYPFTNCTNCGPRYSITRALPYDRPQTSMSCFPLCPACAEEYSNPMNRRFHAQPNACPVCGPQVWFTHEPERLRGGEAFVPEGAEAYGEDALELLLGCLLKGKIAAVKGLGGFHLACDACSSEAVRKLRRLKQRPHKPLAVMAASLSEAEKFARVGEPEKELLLSPERPIVLCPFRPEALIESGPLAIEIAPDARHIGIMLPYTPLHSLLLEALAAARPGLPAVLVMTSGNRSGEPIALGNREAVARLREFADCFLMHNRDILIRNDDSALRPMPRTQREGWADGDHPVMLLRRARGYVPRPLPMPGVEESAASPCVLALGAELKNTICLTRGAEAFVSQHIGDLEDLRTKEFQGETISHLQGVLQVRPEFIVRDAHPDFVNARSEFPLPALALQHHFAHAEAVLAENGVTKPALVLALDGMGYSSDGTVWGGELLYVAPESNTHERVGRLAHLPLPGGDAAVREPWRVAHGLLCLLGLEKNGNWPWLPRHAKTAAVLRKMLELGVNTPLTSSCGRLFDAASALLGACLEISYEAQAAIMLETLQGYPGEDFYGWIEAAAGSALPCPWHEAAPGDGAAFVLDTHTLFRALAVQVQAGAEPVRLARLFHWSLAEGLADLAAAGSAEKNTRLVGLSGGVMQNMSLLTLLKRKLRERGLTPLTHNALPSGDACISYGQAVWAARGAHRV